MTRREGILREMGLAPLWRLRDKPAGDSPSPPAPAPRPTAGFAQPAGSGGAKHASRNPAFAPPAGEGSVEVGAAGEVRLERSQRIAAMGWDELKATVAGCRDCRLCEQRKQAVLGVGDIEADWLFVGEGPGAEEDERGEPFVGQAGKLLDAMLASIGLQRGRKVYIGNAVKCRPPGNRTPEAAETAACFPYLQRQIELIRPKLIVALGKPAAETLLDAEVKVGASRGRLFDYRGIPLIVTYHPAYLLRNLTDKAKAWEDLCFAQRTMQGLPDVAR
jgi:uracil-DNA glycosylase family 4